MTEADCGKDLQELPMIWNKEFSLRMICDDLCIVNDGCRTHWDVVRASICEDAE